MTPTNDPTPGRCTCGRKKIAAWMAICTTCANQVRLTALVCSSHDPAINAWPDENNGLQR